MKITISKSQWKEIGKTAGWITAYEELYECDGCHNKYPSEALVHVEENDTFLCSSCANRSEDSAQLQSELDAEDSLAMDRKKI